MPLLASDPSPKDAGAEAMAHLRDIARHLIEVEHQSSAWFWRGIADYQSGAPTGMSLAEALGLMPQPGHEPWWRIEARQRRDALLRGIARDFFAGEPSTSSQAQAIANALARYAAAGWLRHRPFKSFPARGRGGLEERLFKVLKCCGVAPAERTIRKVLAGSETPSFHGQRGARSFAA